MFKNNCAQCHGSGAAGGKGYPNLLDNDWLWGGDMEAIHTTISHGIRNETDADARYSEMPKFGADGLLEAAQIGEVVEYVLQISGQEHDAALGLGGGHRLCRKLRRLPYGRRHRGPCPRRTQSGGRNLALWRRA
ncbi:MAG: c-type cytochrome [Cypionkella sp.]|nr:c-type cytochrome [Cypionkella sp.]